MQQDVCNNAKFNATLISATDQDFLFNIGDSSIHPSKKQIFGKRTAFLMLNDVKNITYKNYTYEG